MNTVYRVEHLHQPGGWLSPGYLEIGDDGLIVSAGGEAPENRSYETLLGFGVPGLANLHSHAFQRALAGRAEFTAPGRAEDDFWTWREEMYRLAGRINPDESRAVAAMVYLEMLQTGMTSVCEFHYIHHAPGGKPFADPAEMSESVTAAAVETGIGMTLLPVLYTQDAPSRPASGAQLRFVNPPDSLLALIETLRRRFADRPGFGVGMALHSLRAVSADQAFAAVNGVRVMDSAAPLHIHAAETRREVEEVKAALGARPVQWILDNMDAGPDWTLVHATHMDAAEISGLAKSGAVAGLCPMTEGSLGDGIFPLIEYHRAGGVWGAGTDSHCCVSTQAELSMLEYGQRLVSHRRNVLAAPESGGGAAHSGRVLFDAALKGGAQASGQNTGALVPGRRADLVMLDAECGALIGHGPETALDAWLLGAAQNPVRDVMVAGAWVIKDRRHPREDKIKAAYAGAVKTLQ